MSMTAHFSATAPNINAALNGTTLELTGKNDRVDFDPSLPLMYKGNGGTAERMDYQSVVTGYMDGLGHTSRFSKGIIQVTNNSVMHLYRKALEEQYSWTRYNNRIRTYLPASLREKVVTSENLSAENKAFWYRKNGYCYNLLMPGDTPVLRMTELMYSDLNRIFPLRLGITAEVEKVKATCLVLRAASGHETISSSGGDKSYEKTHALLKIRNRPFRMFADALAFEYQDLQMPFISDIVYTGNSDIEIHAPLSDLPAVRRELNKYGLRLTEEERLIDMLVFRATAPEHSANDDSSSVLPLFKPKR
jgi:hypothetical protein